MNDVAFIWANTLLLHDFTIWKKTKKKSLEYTRYNNNTLLSCFDEVFIQCRSYHAKRSLFYRNTCVILVLPYMYLRNLFWNKIYDDKFTEYEYGIQTLIVFMKPYIYYTQTHMWELHATRTKDFSLTLLSLFLCYCCNFVQKLCSTFLFIYL